MTPCEFRPLDALGKPEEHSLTQPWPWIRLPCFPLPAAGAARTHQWPSLTDCLAGTKKAPALNARASQPFPEGIMGRQRGDLNATLLPPRALAEHKCVNPLLRKTLKGRIDLAIRIGIENFDLPPKGRSCRL